MREIGPAELVEHGIRIVGDDRTVRARERTQGAIFLLSMHGTSTEFAVVTAPAHPDHAILAFIDADARWARDGSWTEVKKGMVIAAPETSGTLQCPGSWHATVAFIPCAAMSLPAASVPRDARGYPDRRLLDLAMQRFIDGLLGATEQATTVERYALERLILDFAGAILRDRIGPTTSSGSAHTDLRDRAIALISQQCADPNLSPPKVANQVQSSLRRLQLAFAEFGTGVASEIRRQRAQLAHSLLTDSRYDTLSVNLIAQRSGFQSSMSLRRALNETYQTTPRDLRSHPRF